MIVVTGGAGFIGSNLVHGLNHRGIDDIVVVDDLSDGSKFRNLADARIRDYLDRHEFRQMIEGDAADLRHMETLFHQGACTDTTEWDGRYIMENNYRYSKLILEYCLRHDVRLIYASSAAVYGIKGSFNEDAGNEAPVNVYGWSKSLFDHHARLRLVETPGRVAGLRYFNVYGPGEAHKGGMASVVWHFNRQLADSGTVRLFRGSGGYADGEQRRDFVHVNDVVAVNLWLMDEPQTAGIYNVGTGRSRSFNDVAGAVIDWHGRGRIDYIDFPSGLEEAYQNFTEADIGKLRQSGCTLEFRSLEDGVQEYLNRLNG